MTAIEITGDEPIILYRLYDAAGALLYVGITHSLRVRFRRHAKEKPWWPQVAKRTAEWYGSKREARHAETAAIHNEAPLHNIQGRPGALRASRLSSRAGLVAATFRMPNDVLAAVRLQAKADGLTLTAVMTRLLRAYGEGDPRALAAVAGVSVEAYLAGSARP